MGTKIWNFLTKGWFSYLLVGLGIIFITMISVKIGNSDVQNEGKNLIGELKDDISQCKLITEDASLTQIKSQHTEIIGRANKHRESALSFFGKFYGTLLAFWIAGALAAIALALITKTGVEKANPHIVTVFLTATALATFF